MTPPKPPREVKLTVPDEATQREVLELYEQVDRLSRHADIPTPDFPDEELELA
jgi:hypothetical protein